MGFEKHARTGLHHPGRTPDPPVQLLVEDAARGDSGRARELAGTRPRGRIAYTFSQWYYVVIYLVWFAALWFHLTHGVWSMFQTVGWANDTWYPRLKCIANIVATIIFLGFAAVVLVYFFCPCIAGAC